MTSAPEHAAAPRVLVDATAVPADRGGVGRYVDGVVGELTGDVVVVCQRRDAKRFKRLAPRATIVSIAPRWQHPAARLIWEQVRLPRIARATGATVIFSPHYTMPLFTRMPRVVTLHDATFFSDPQVHTALKRRFFRSWIRFSSRHADALIAPSAATANEVCRFVGADRARFHVAYHGVDPTEFHIPSPDDIDAMRARLELGNRPYIAFLGTLEPRKNLPELIDAYAAVVKRLGADAPDLVIAGGVGWNTDLERHIAAVPEGGRVILAGYLPLEMLSAFLGGARVVAYPSLGEGFGLPVLEAMACGSAVLTTRRLALPEVGGDAVAYADVDAASIAAQLVAMLSSPDELEAFGVKGVARASQFTWRRSAAVHSTVFASVSSRV